MDRITKSQRSANMAKVRSRDTSPEMIVRRIAHAFGLRYRLHVRRLPGTPDLVFPRWRKIVFIHGCFWHQHRKCHRATMPKTRRGFWSAKFKANITRDEQALRRLKVEGWDVLVLWECQTKQRLGVEKRLARFFEISTL